MQWFASCLAPAGSSIPAVQPIARLLLLLYNANSSMIFALRRMINFRLHPVLNKTVALSGLLAALSAFPAFADDYTDVTKALRAGQLTEASNKADAFLTKNPRDAQMRFLKGVILTEQNKSADAIVAFTKLSEDYPGLPEPYNNLAVLYAAAGNFEKARLALDSAIRTNPTYATAYENLGDVHAKLASQAYDKALQLDSGNVTAKSKLTLVRSLVSNANSASAKVPPAAPSAPPPMVIAKAPETAAPAATRPVPVPAPTPAPATKPAPQAAKPEADKPVQKQDDEREDREAVTKAINGWARAWSAQDVKSYIGYYSHDFQTPNGETRKAWEEDRRARIVGKTSISVKLEGLQVTVNGTTATAKFHQSYASNRLSTNSRKTLVLAKHGGKWQIKQESSGS
jgi:tetratricopeptide (TPR) repeat protein